MMSGMTGAGRAEVMVEPFISLSTAGSHPAGIGDKPGVRDRTGTIQRYLRRTGLTGFPDGVNNVTWPRCWMPQAPSSWIR